MLAAITFVAASGRTRRQLPSVFGASWQTVHRRFSDWSAARVRAKLDRVALDRLGAGGELDWSRCAIDSMSVRAVKGAIGRTESDSPARRNAAFDAPESMTSGSSDHGGENGKPTVSRCP